jgi:hypothetical protein
MSTPIPQHFLSKIGEIYQKITIIDLKIQSKKPKVIYKCECGNIGICSYYALNKSCKKCYNIRRRENKTTHGLSNSPEYISWKAMTKRCRNPKDPAFHNYGGRGIKVCKRWLGENGFTNFMKDVGERPSPKNKYSIERINVNENYSPENCKWATKQDQLLNKRPYLPTYDKQCTVCKKNYRGYFKNLYCSRACQSIAYRKRKRQSILNTTSPE